MKTYKEMYDELPIQKGDYVKILKGTRITTHPKGPYNALATYVVDIHDVSPGYDANDYHI